MYSRGMPNLVSNSTSFSSTLQVVKHPRLFRACFPSLQLDVVQQKLWGKCQPSLCTPLPAILHSLIKGKVYVDFYNEDRRSPSPTQSTQNWVGLSSPPVVPTGKSQHWKSDRRYLMIGFCFRHREVKCRKMRVFKKLQSERN